MTKSRREPRRTDESTDHRVDADLLTYEIDDAAETRYVLVRPALKSHQSAGVYEVVQNDENGDVDCVRLFGSGKRNFTVSAANFAMFARLGVNLVQRWQVTPAQFDSLVEQLGDLDEDSLVAFARENAVSPPE